MSGQPYFIVDAFTHRPFGGNPAAVVPLTAPADPRYMQQVAMEMNLSETAFVRPDGDGFDLRWFTPAHEEDLCGHATLATAHVLYHLGWVKPGAVARFSSRSGPLSARQEEESIRLDFPAEPDRPADPPDLLRAALGVTPLYTGRNRLDYLLEVENEAVLRAVTPDFLLLDRLEARGVILTCASHDPAYDFKSRFFAPRVGVPEDPVTGSAHCCLGPYWQRRLGKSDFTAYQASARGGVLTVRVRGPRVELAGQAVMVARGELLASE